MSVVITRQTRFKKLQSIDLDYAPIKVTQYESSRTGMRAVVVDQEGPKVNGYFALATEIHDDSGAPHTLEHLCFMGSRNYRYKGLLDKLATRAYSTTNAWTSVEQTAYKLDTAGWDGFAQILPVYLEHVLMPTLTDAGCYTEVHHIDGTGHDAGVVYSEMQGVQNEQAELMQLAAQRLMYPPGNGFRYETGGMMEQLRVLTTDRIRQFHKEMYQPKNLCLVLTGEIKHDQLLQILDEFEDTIVDDVPAIDAPFKRPWVDSTPTPPLSRTTVETVEFPDEDETMGEILVGMLGPKCNDHMDCAALSVLLIYLCGSSISVLEHTLVEKEQLCSMVYYNVECKPDLVIWFSCSAVAVEKLEHVEQRLMELLREAASKEMDMDYMQNCISRWRRQIKNKCENAGDFFATPIIEDHLFGRRDGRDLKEISHLKELDALAGWSDKRWREFLGKYIALAHHISILGKPSQELAKQITCAEKERINAQKERLGEAGMTELAERLQAAQAENDRPIPDDLLEKFPIPSTNSVRFISTTSARAGRARNLGPLDNDIQRIVDADDDDAPLFIHFEHIPSNFVRIKLEMCTASIPLELKPLLSLWMMNFFATPVMRNGKQIAFEDLVLDLEKETVRYEVDSERANAEMVHLVLETEPDKYASVIGWLRTLLFDAVHDPERLYASVAKLLADVPDEKRSGDSMAYSINAMIQYQQQSSVRACNTLSKALYLKRIKRLLQVDKKVVVAQFAQLCVALHRVENFRVFVSANVTKLPNPVSAWKTLSEGFDVSKPLEPLGKRKDLLSEIGRAPGATAYVVPMAAIDSSFALLTAKGVDSFDHPDLPAMMVARAYLDAVEGPLWVAVRGTGLAYGTAFMRSVDTGLIMFKISRSPDAYKAFLAAKEQVAGFASGKYPLDKFALEGAISEIVLGMADEQPTMASAAEYSFANQVIRGIARDWSHMMLARVHAVTPPQIRDVLSRYFLPIFEPASSNLVVTCAQIMTEKLRADFTAAGYAPEMRTLESFQDDYGLPPVDGLDDEEDDEDDDDDEGDDEMGDGESSDRG